MRRVTLLILTVFICCFFISCNKPPKRPDLEFNDFTDSKPETSVEPDSYELPCDMNMVMNTKQFLLIKLVDCFNSEGYKELILNSEDGCVEGKFIYSKFTGTRMVNSYRRPVYKMGYMNKDFTYITDAVYDKAYPYEDGVAVVKTDKGYGVIGSSGEIIIECLYDNIPEFSTNQIRIVIEENDEVLNHKYFDKKTGSYLYSINQGKGESEEVILNKVLVDNSSQIISGIPEWESDDRIVFRDEESMLQGYTDGFGNIIIAPRFENAFPFSGEYARITKDGKFGYIDNKGKIVIKPQFDEAYDFSYGLARVKKEDLYGFIDIEGNLAIDYQYKKANDFFRDGASVSKTGALWGYITENNRLVANYKFALPSKFAFGYAPVYDTEKRAYIYIDGDQNPILGELSFFRASEINEDGYAVMHNIVPSGTGANRIMVEEYYFLLIK